MEKLVLYHGSIRIIEKPLFGYKNPNSDYGSGFYCTTDIEAAREWACKLTKEGLVNKYKIDISGLNVLDLTDSKYNVFHWITLLLKNRTISEDILHGYKPAFDYLFERYSIDISKYDIVIGYRADDAYFKFPLAFIRGNITIKQMEKIFSLGNLGKQVVLVSKKAFDRLEFVSYESVEEKYHEKYRSRILTANRDLYDLIGDKNYKDETLVDVVRKALK